MEATEGKRYIFAELYLYCNLPLDVDSVPYTRIEEELLSDGIRLIPVCDISILDEIANEKIYIQEVFFGNPIKQHEKDKYYEDVVIDFEEEEDSILGSESLADSYIEPYTEDGTMLEKVEDWFYESKPGVMLLYGEPGDTKQS